MRVTRALTIFFAVPVAVQLILLASMYLFLGDFSRKIEEQIELKELQTQLDFAQRLQTESLGCACLASLTSIERFKDQHKDCVGNLREVFAKLEALSANHPDTRAVIRDFIDKEKELIEFEFLVQTPLVSPVTPVRGQVLVRQAVGSMRKAMAQLDTIEAKLNAKPAQHAELALAFTVLVFLFEIAVAVKWSSVIFGSRLNAIFDRIVEFQRGDEIKGVSDQYSDDELTRVELAISDAARRIRELESTRQQLSSIVAHDLRAPLTSIAGSVELLESGRFGELPIDTRSKLRSIQATSSNLQFAMNLLLEFSRLSAQEQLDNTAVSRQTFEDAIYEELENAGLEHLEAFSLEINAPQLSVPAVPLARTIAYMLKALVKDGSAVVAVTDSVDKTSIAITVSNIGESEEQTQCLKIAAAMATIYGAQFHKRNDGTKATISFAFNKVNNKGLASVGQSLSLRCNRSFQKKFLVLICVTMSLNILTAIGLLSTWQTGQKVLVQETSSRGIVRAASSVTSAMTELMILSVLQDPQVGQVRKRVLGDIKGTIASVEAQAKTPQAKADIATWKGNIAKIFKIIQSVALGLDNLTVTLKELVSEDQDRTLFAHTGQSIVENEKETSQSSKRLLVMLSQLGERVMAISIVAMCASLFAAILLGRYLISRLNHMEQNADLLRARKPLAKSQGGNDDIANLDRFFFEAASQIDIMEKERAHLLSLLREDLSVPIRNMQKSLESIREADDNLPERARHFIDLAACELSRLAFLVDDLECASSIGIANSLVVHPVPTDVSTIIEKTIDSLSFLSKQKSIALHNRSWVQPGTRIVADEHRVEQVLVNLITNAIKFSPQNSTVAVEVTDSEGAVRITVIDSGPGIAAQEQERLFQRFARVDNKAEGVGLGLFICKTLVEIQGGSIGLVSHLGDGSRFWISFPIEKKKLN